MVNLRAVNIKCAVPCQSGPAPTLAMASETMKTYLRADLVTNKKIRLMYPHQVSRILKWLTIENG